MWQSTYSPVKAGSVPALRRTRYCSGVRRLRHSSSESETSRGAWLPVVDVLEARGRNMLLSLTHPPRRYIPAASLKPATRRAASLFSSLVELFEPGVAHFGPGRVGGGVGEQGLRGGLGVEPCPVMGDLAIDRGLVPAQHWCHQAGRRRRLPTAPGRAPRRRCEFGASARRRRGAHPRRPQRDRPRQRRTVRRPPMGRPGRGHPQPSRAPLSPVRRSAPPSGAAGRAPDGRHRGGCSTAARRPTGRRPPGAARRPCGWNQPRSAIREQPCRRRHGP